MAEFDLQAPFKPAGDQPRAIAELSAGLLRGDRFQTLLGRHRLRQDDVGRQRHQGARPADARALAQQDARGAAVRGAQELLPAQRGRVLHLVLRLLPARSVRPDDRHVHREGRVDQRGHRPPAPARDVEPDGARRRHHRRHRLRDLRPRRSGRSIASGWCTLARGRVRRARRHSARARRHPVLAQRRLVRARHVPRARRHGRDLSGVRGAGRAHRDVGRRGRADLEDRRRSPARRSPISSAPRSIRRSTSSPRARRSSARSRSFAPSWPSG